MTSARPTPPPALVSDHPVFGTCTQADCPMRGVCHCAPDCPQPVRIASRTYGVARIVMGHPMMYALGHSPRGARRVDRVAQSDHPADAESRERISEMLDDLSLDEIAALSGLTTDEVERIRQGGAGSVYAVKRLREAHRRHGGIGAAMLPAAPLRAHLMTAIAARQYIDPAGSGALRGGASDLARDYADRFGGTQQSASRLLHRVLSQDTVTIETGDRLAVLLGLHPSLIWPEEWSA